MDLVLIRVPVLAFAHQESQVSPGALDPQVQQELWDRPAHKEPWDQVPT